MQAGFGFLCVAEKRILSGFLDVWLKDYVKYVFIVCVFFFKESCEVVCRWLNLTLYNSLGTAQLLVSV